MNNSKLQKNHSLERETITDRKGRKRPTGKRKESAEKPQERDYESECVQSVIQTGRGDYQPPGDPGDSGLEQLKVWVDYANAHGSVILFDSAYEAFITEEGIPHSIFEVEGAETCAIEFRSFSKSAGFTGTRCAYTVIPKALKREGVSLRDLWNRRQGSKFNGVPYVIQRAAEAALSPEGRAQTKIAIDYYLDNAKVVREGLAAAGLAVYGGVNAPYLWVRTPNDMPSWAFFDLLLKKACVVTTPGAGFGPSGEGYIRITAFGDADATKEAVQRIVSVL